MMLYTMIYEDAKKKISLELSRVSVSKKFPVQFSVSGSHEDLVQVNDQKCHASDSDLV